MAPVLALRAEPLPELFTQYCLKCHGGEEVEGEFDWTAPWSFEGLEEAYHLIDAEEMPTKGPEPSARERVEMMAWIREQMTALQPPAADQQTISRLTRRQYGHAMRDLLGLDLHPEEFLAEDGQGPSGFRNDRANLSLNPAEFEKFIAAADRAIQGLQALDSPPQSWVLEAETMTVSAPRQPVHRDGLLLVTEGQLATQMVEIPVDGYYEVTLHAATYGKPVQAQIFQGTEVVSRISINHAAPETQPHRAVIFFRAGHPQLAINSRNFVPQVPLPQDPQTYFNERAEENALEVPPLPEDATEADRKAREALIAKCVALQQAFEWLRGLGVEGDPRDIERFRRYARERRVGTEQVRKWYGTEVLGLEPAEWDGIWAELNAERLKDNEGLLERADQVEWESWMQHQGKLYLDRMGIRGPIRPMTARELLDVSDSEKAIKELLPRAFRRPIPQEESERYFGIYHHSLEGGTSSAEALRTALAAILASPHFLYHQDHSIASKLSFFLWQSIPDATLMELQTSGGLNQPSILRREVDRMLKDSRFEDSMRIFMEEWLGTANLGASQMPDSFQYPEFTPEVLLASKEEPARFFLHLVRNNLPVTDLLGADYALIDERLADFYGLPWQGQTGWQVLPAQDKNRGGILGMSAVLASTSTAVRTSPSTRGAWVWETLLGKEVGDPLPDAGILAATAGEASGRTLREEMELHRSDPRCIRCHELIDPIGLGLENYNAIGLWRDRMANQPIDASGTLKNGASFAGPQELRRQLLGNGEEFTQQVARMLLSYALGRELTWAEEPAVEEIASRSQGRAHRLFQEIATSDLFLKGSPASP